MSTDRPYHPRTSARAMGSWAGVAGCPFKSDHRLQCFEPKLGGQTATRLRGRMTVGRNPSGSVGRETPDDIGRSSAGLRSPVSDLAYTRASPSRVTPL